MKSDIKSENKWYVRSTAGKVFGPITLETLKGWVRDGRVEPLAGISCDLANWTLAPLKPELEMNWVVENNPGQFYGPTHRAVVDDLIAAGALSLGARFFQDDRGSNAAAIEAARDEALAAAEQAAVAEKAALAAEKDARIAELESALTRAKQDFERRAAEQKAEFERRLAEQQTDFEKRFDRQRLEFAGQKQDFEKRFDRQKVELAEQKQILAQKDARLVESEKALARKDADLVRKDADLAERDKRLAEKDARIDAGERTLAARDAALAERDKTIAEKNEALAARDVVAPRVWKAEVVVPEVVSDQPPPSVARQAFTGNVSLAELERQAQRELAKMGASNARRFFHFGKK